jgi:Sulfotransferase family
VTLDEHELRAAAERSTGLGDWGDDESWTVGLGVLVAALDQLGAEPALLQSARDELVSKLEIRLRLVADERRHPEVTSERIERPLIVVGLPRTGTSILFNLLSLDPVARPPQRWEATSPWPAPERTTYDSDPRIAAMESAIEALLATTPELRAIHPYGARQPVECTVIMVLHFASTLFWTRFDVPRFGRWLIDERVPGLYRTHERVLQQLQWKGPRGRWTLKSPQHLFDLEGLLETYPDACLVQTHREPARTMASLSSLVAAVRRSSAGDSGTNGRESSGIHGYGLEADPHAVGRSVVELWGAALERATISRRNPRIDQAVIDVAYRDTVTDPVGTVRRIYDRFGLPFTREHADRIGRHMEETKPERRGEHRYTLEEYGLDRERLAASFPAYRSRFGELLGEPAPASVS